MGARAMGGHPAPFSGNPRIRTATYRHSTRYGTPLRLLHETRVQTDHIYTVSGPYFCILRAFAHVMQLRTIRTHKVAIFSHVNPSSHNFLRNNSK